MSHDIPTNGPGRAAGLSYTAGLKEALTGRPGTPFVWLCNFEVERWWAHGRPGLPAVRGSATTPLVQRMEELGALLAEPGDHLLLDRPLDPAFRRYAERTRFGLPAELVTDAPAGSGGTARAVLDSPGLLTRLKELAADGARLMPMGNSRLEQRIGEVTGLRPAVPDAVVFERVNSKIYSRRLARELGLREVPGYSCETVGELREALERELPEGASPDGEGGGPVVVKDAYGVSGKGLVVLSGRARAEKLLRMVERRARATGSDAVHVVVERFLPKRADLNYQFTVDHGGRVRFDFVKEALTSGGVHQGHLMPAGLSAAQRAELEEAARRLGARLYEDGFFGVVGVDALVGTDERVYPVLEVNARLNMSSYQGRVTERFLAPGGTALARHYPLRLARPASFAEIEDALGGLAAPPQGGTGLVVTCFGTVNAAASEPFPPGGTPFDGRLYTVLFARDREELDRLDRAAAEALGRLGALDRGTPRRSGPPPPEAPAVPGGTPS